MEKLKKGILSEGFALEYRTTKVFEELNFDVLPNQSFQDANSDKNCEIDLIAMNKINGSKGLFVLECKGTSSKNKLILIESYEKPGKLPNYCFRNFSSENQIVFYYDFIDLGQQASPLVTYTGDFFKPDGSRVSKNETKSNFFKGVNQLLDGMSAYLYHISRDKKSNKDEYFCYPCIVTNAEILVAQFTGGPSDVQPKLSKVPWAIYQNFETYSEGFLNACTWRDGQASGTERVKKSLPYIWIVNIENISKFSELPTGSLNYDDEPRFE